MTKAKTAADRDSRYCGGPKRQGEGTCTRPAGWGTPHPGVGRCKLHGGSTKSHVESARQELARRELAKLVWNPDAKPVTDSVSEMRRMAGALGQAVDVLGSRLNGEVCESCGRGPESLDGVTAAAWMRGIREQRQLLADMERLGIAGRALELSEAQAAAMFAIHQQQLELLQRELPGGLPPGLRELLIKTVLAGLPGGVVGQLEAGGAA